ncbi:MAG: hypothetical protein JO303_08580 [Caulobacteraceae bacterium]|nr:hypothetical protein [Caulobacteraceae bacterium]
MLNKYLRAAALVSASSVSTLIFAAPAAAGAQPASTAEGLSSHISTASSGWVGDRNSYGASAPTGDWEFQYDNSFAGVPVKAGGFTTWDKVVKPPAANWPVAMFQPYSGKYARSNPETRTDNSPSGAGSQTSNSAYVYYYTGFGLYQAYEDSKSTAFSKIVGDNPAVAKTQVTDPTTLDQPEAGNWTLTTTYVQIGSFSDAQPGSNIYDQDLVTLQPSSPGGAPVTYTLFSVLIGADGGVTVTTSLNGNDAVTSGSLLPGLNGVLKFDGEPVTAAQAAHDLEGFYNAKTGWNLDPGGYGVDTLDLLDPAEVDSVFSLEASVFLDNATAAAVISSVDGSTAVSATPEPASWALMLSGVFGLGTMLRLSQRRQGWALAKV